ncbi:hypothetical protein LOTGIDRAFT_108535 [Lottia gigantea]|uniref:Uncharacterized protein n=1 Tax=Lottia gigantea TaxID=225164 RepID=V3Z0X4_LOTGI|nr:hypothetical protein LOTGIDRAFT_108535 [Lottia gigantea]ESO84173.1 hypothetical protein LOTGIDRAFT_108535 [Lottia gigantea]
MKRLVIVGDGKCGKSSLIRRYIQQEFLQDHYIPTLFDVSTKQVETENDQMMLVIHDTAGQTDLDSLRPFLYYRSDVIIVCFSVDNPCSLVNIKDKWKDEVSKYCTDVPIILVGTKSDLAESASLDRCEKCKLVSRIGHTMSTIIGADKYLECSALENKGITEVFEEALNLAIARDIRQRRRSSIFRRGSVLLGFAND